MSALIFLLVVLVVFTFLVVRSVRAGHGLFLLWLVALAVFPIVLLSMNHPTGAVARLLVNLVVLSLIVTPVYLVLRWIAAAPKVTR